MIHQLLSLKRPLFVLDTEDTGVDPQKDRILEIGFQMWEPEKVMTREWRSLVNPGIHVPEGSTKIHGISDFTLTCCQTCGLPPNDCRCETPRIPPTFKQLAANLAKGFSDCDYAGQNIRFDLRILAAEFTRAGVPWSYVGARIIDSSQLERLAVPRTLSHLHQKYTGHVHDGAHGALSDVRAAATVIAAQLQEHQSLPRDLDQLHEMSWPGWLCDGGQFKMIDGVPTCCFGKKWNGRAMKDIDVGYYDWILSQDFPADVKHLAAEAKLKRFPK